MNSGSSVALASTRGARPARVAAVDVHVGVVDDAAVLDLLGAVPAHQVQHHRMHAALLEDCRR